MADATHYLWANSTKRCPGLESHSGAKMIITRTPFRVTLGGGGTDLPSFYREHGGFILAAAIDKYMFLNVNTPIIDDKIRVRYSKSELIDHVDEIQHTLAREALRHFGVAKGI